MGLILLVLLNLSLVGPPPPRNAPGDSLADLASQLLPPLPAGYGAGKEDL